MKDTKCEEWMRRLWILVDEIWDFGGETLCSNTGCFKLVEKNTFL